MAHTIVGLFDTVAEAEEAVNELVESGFDRNNIDVSSGQVDDDGNIQVTEGNTTWNEDEHTTFGESVSNFFKSLFNGKDEAYKYSEVARRHAIVSVYASSVEEAEDAADILDECGAMDVEERANLYTNTITTNGTTLGHSLNREDERSLGNVNDRVTQYGDQQNRDRIQTGTFQDPVGGDLDDRVSSFADTTTTINTNNTDSENTSQSDVNTQPGRWKSRIFETPSEESIRLKQQNYNRNLDEDND